MNPFRRGCGRVIVAGALVVLTSCTAGQESATTASPRLPSGGTLRVAAVLDGSQGICWLRMCGEPFDPQTRTVGPSFELAHCCLMRTLVGFNGRSVDQGGSELQPDLAVSLPTVSSDGLTWTFSLRHGVHYAPPMAGTQVVATDFIRSFERVLSPSVPENGFWYPDAPKGGYFVEAYLPDVIEGARDFVDGKTDHISGLEAPSLFTLVVHLTQPTGDLGYRLSQTQLGPIPANPARPADPFGMAQGHDGDYGDFIVSSGPYMFEGADALDVSTPADQQEPPSGDALDHMVLVRNPSWSPEIDPLHTASSDRIEIYRVADNEEAERLIRTGAVDVTLDWFADPQTVARWRSDPTLRDRMHLAPEDAMTYLELNVALPPFDDLAVRKAVDLVVDRDSLAATASRKGDSVGQPLTHSTIDSLEDNLLLTWSPPGVKPGGDIATAREAMASSKYDRNGDGRCDASVCSGIELWFGRHHEGRSELARSVIEQLAAIGLQVRSHPVRDLKSLPAAHIAMGLGGWAKDFPSASTFLPLLFSGESIASGCCNGSMIGASPAQLRSFGYDVSSVPSVDGRIAECQQQLFQAQVQCWASLDQYLSSEVVPIVPLTQIFLGWAVSSRVRDFSVDTATAIPLPSLGVIRVVGPSPAPAPTLSPPAPASSIPDGIYTTTVTAAQLDELFPAADRGYWDEDAGMYTIRLEGGRFSFDVVSEDHAIFNPMIAGSYSGTGDEIRFQYEAPIWVAHEKAELRWLDQGGDITFTMPRCTGEAARHPDECAVQRALFTGEPWRRIGP
jgi:peptide/nickel transport system substrate-binding protein